MCVKFINFQGRNQVKVLIPKIFLNIGGIMLMQNQDENKVLFQLPEFSGANVPVKEVAKIMKKDALSIRLAMQNGLVDLGYCQKKPNSEQWEYYISPFKLFLLTGYIYNPDKEDSE